MNDKILTIQDVSCYGQCSATVALPILSAFGYETAVLPSAILSTHTGGFKNFTVRDLTDDLDGIIAHWKSENISFGCIYTGYIGDERQFDTVLTAKKNLLSDGGLFVVDPAMADNGKLYVGLNEKIAEGMRKIVSVADYVLPNVTEACLITGKEYKEVYDEAYIKSLLDALSDTGVKIPVITGVCYDGKKIGAVSMKDGKTVQAFGEKQPNSYHGTGDIFSSVVVAGLKNGETLEKTLQRAVDFVIDCIKRTDEDDSHRYGVKFEKVLKEGKYL